MEKIERLDALRETYDIAVLTVSDQEETASRELAEQHGYIHYHEPTYYDTWDF